jgi:3D (Asp-Asp-Asp) domain-containing protein
MTTLLRCLCVAVVFVLLASSNVSGERLKVTITAYTNVRSCTDRHPDLTASMLKLNRSHYHRLIALSPDLAKRFKFGDKFAMKANSIWYLVEFQDVMPRGKNKVDFLLPSVKDCKIFGRKKGVLVHLNWM